MARHDFVCRSHYNLAMQNFVERYGLVQYNCWNIRKYRYLDVCEWCEPEDPWRPTSFDHCHRHGWIRGEICQSHNGRLKRIDKLEYPDRWKRWMIQHWLRCPECAGTPTGHVLSTLVDDPHCEAALRSRYFPLVLP
jgi:recombination endonuclease VII